MDKSDLSVSVIIPTYNGAKTIRRAIESVLDQGHKKLDIIVIDDGSTDSTALEVSGFKGAVKYYRQNNRGPSGARNYGIKMSAADIVGLLDDDDTWTPGSLSLQLDCFARDPGVEIVCGYTQYKWLADSGADAAVTYEAREPVLSFNFGSAVYKRSVFDKAGLFDEDKRSCEDVDWFLRARESGIKMIVLEKTTLIYNKYPEGISYGKDIHESNFLKEIKASLDRRRNISGSAAKPLSELPRVKPSCVKD